MIVQSHPIAYWGGNCGIAATNYSSPIIRAAKTRDFGEGYTFKNSLKDLTLYIFIIRPYPNIVPLENSMPLKPPWVRP